MIRPTEPRDRQTLLALAEATGVFKPHEITALDEVLRDYHGGNLALGHHCVTFVDAGTPLGFAYYAPASMADRAWYLYWIAVSKSQQAHGIGGQLLAYLEDHIRQLRGRLLFVETSSLPQYDLTRKFYAKHGYDQIAALTDFYADGDSMIVFNKRLSEVGGPASGLAAMERL